MYAVRCHFSLDVANDYYYYYYIRLMSFFSRTTWVGWHQKGKPFWNLLEQEMMGCQCHQLDHMQIICTSVQTDNRPVHHHSVFTGCVPVLPPNQQRQCTEGILLMIANKKIINGLY